MSSHQDSQAFDAEVGDARPDRLRPRQPRRSAWPWVLTGILVLLLAAAGWVGIRGWIAFQEAEAAKTTLAGIGEQMREDPAAAVETLAAAGTHSEQAARLTSDPVWRAAEFLPFLGSNFTAFRVTADGLDALVREVGLPLVEPASQLEGALRPVSGRIDPTPLVALRPAATAAAARVDGVEQDLEELNTALLLPQVADAVAELEEQLAPVSAGVRAVYGATQLLPALLGVDEPRETLLLFLNNAEVRSTVGIPGALALIRTENGTIELAQQASTRDFPGFTEPVMELPADIRGIYGDLPALFMQNITYVPQFPLSAELAVTMWERQFGNRPQAVLALDPFTLQGILGATGPVSLATGEILTSENAADFLLHQVYIDYPEPAMQDAVFADAAARVFEAVAFGNAEPSRMIDALVGATMENRVKFWSSIDAEQSVVEGSSLAGALPRSAAGEARFGWYLNDGTGSKMDYFLTSAVEVLSGGCPVIAEAPTVTLRITLTNTAPADAAASLPDYITGGGAFIDAPLGSILTVTQLVAPPGFTLLRSSVDGQAQSDISSELAFGRSLVTWSPLLAPGGQGVLEVTYDASNAIGAELTWQQTPTFGQTPNAAESRLCGS